MRIKTFRLLSLLIPIFPLIFTQNLAQSQASEGVKSFERYRAENSRRTYQFLLNSEPFGTLESVYDGTARFKGSRGHRLIEKLNLDFSSFANPYKLTIENEHYSDDSGRYLGDEMSLRIDNVSQELFLSYKNGKIAGYLERDRQKDNIERDVPLPVFAVDNYLVDQLELFLAFHDLNVGDTITDSFFVPQTAIFSPARYIVEGFARIPYGNMVDSAFICRFLEPLEQTAYVTRDRRLIKLVQPYQNITIVLNETILDRLRPPKKSFTLSDFVRRLPLYLFFLGIGVVLTAPFWVRYRRHTSIFFAFIAGALVYLLVGVTHIPLQEWYSNRIVFPAIQQGGSIYAFTVGNALLTGLVKELLKILPVILFFYLRKTNLPPLYILGIFCGAGFGIFESGALTGDAYQAGAMKFLSWGVFERITALVFHMTSGALYGWALCHSLPRTVSIFIALFALHSFSAYLIVFVQKKILDIALFELLVALIYLILLLIAYLKISGSPLFNKPPPQRKSGKS